MVKSTLYIVCLFIVAWLSACTNVKNLQYLQGNLDTAKLSAYTVPDPIIQKGDIISIIVFSNNKTASEIYNQPMSSSATGSALQAPGYLVDNQGNIQFQGLGNLYVEGLNKAQLTDTLYNKLKEFLTNPYFNIRFVNFKVTIIGDVARPGSYTIPSEGVNILEALGLAGDLNITARRDNVRVIREQNGRRAFGLIDLRQADIFTSPFYQLKQNDVIYVDLSKSKAAASDQTTARNISVAATVISTLALLYSIFKK